MLQYPATPGGSLSGGDAGDKSHPGFGDSVLSQKLLELASRQAADREEPVLALRFRFREVTERNPNEQKPTKVFESPVAQNHQDRAQLQQPLPGAAQRPGKVQGWVPGMQALPLDWDSSRPHQMGMAVPFPPGLQEKCRNSFWNFTKAVVTLGRSTPCEIRCTHLEICAGASASEASSWWIAGWGNPV